jgi:mediator of RNA polymerase II transcription subunit 17
MGSIPDQFPLSLRAWPPKDDTTTALASLIKRINAERGTFRNVTEESLKEEIKQSEAGADNKGDDGSEEDEVEEEEPDRLKELTSAREELLGQLEYDSQSFIRIHH